MNQTLNYCAKCVHHCLEAKCPVCGNDTTPITGASREETLRSSAWVEALERAKTALRAVLNCDQSMSRAELAIACQEVSDMLDGELRDASASNDPDQRPGK
jgi:hypothetical protein